MANIIARDDDVAFARFANTKGHNYMMSHIYLLIKSCFEHRSTKILGLLLKYIEPFDGSFGFLICRYSDTLNCLEILLKKININATDEFGRTILHYACNYLRFNLIDYLIKKDGIDYEIEDRHGHTVVDILKIRMESQSADVITKISTIIGQIQRTEDVIILDVI